VNAEVLIASDEASSSPSNIIARKGSPAWLHWNYTYVGDGTHNEGPAKITTKYREQKVVLNSLSQPEAKTLASRTGSSGALTLESHIPPQFSGRVIVISPNSTVVIHELQYNDSTYEFSSDINLWVEISGKIFTIHVTLKPVVSITVKGRPDFRAMPPITMDVREGSNLQLPVEMDGNPKPSADFRWPHLTGSSPTNVPSEQLYPFVYSSTYKLTNIDASYCGRILQTILKNSIGSSDTASTNVTVLVKLDMDLGLKAGKIGGAKCVEVKWNKVDSGACYVKYEVVLKSASGSVECSNLGYNIGNMTMCREAPYSNVTDVQLTVSFKSTSKSSTAKVSNISVSTPSSTIHEPTNPPVGQSTTVSMSTADPGTSGNATSSPRKPPDSGSNVGAIVGATIGSLGLVIIVIMNVVFCSRRCKRKGLDAELRLMLTRKVHV